MATKMSDPELIKLQYQNLYLLDKYHSQEPFETMASSLPGLYHTNSLEDLRLVNVTPKATDFIHLEPDEMILMGQQFHMAYVHPYTLQFVFPVFIALYQSLDTQKIVAEVQTLKVKDKWEDILTFTKVNNDLNGFSAISFPVNSMGKSRLMAKVIQDNEFIRLHFDKYMSLTKQEKKILKYVADGLTNREIAEKEFLSPHTVRTHRNSIFRKLEIKNFRQLILYADNFC